MALATFKCEFPMRRAMMSLWKQYSTRVPVLVCPMPTQDGCFIVEHRDGRCQKVQPDSLTFLESRELFDQYSWE